MMNSSTPLAKRNRILGFAIAAATLSLNLSCSHGPQVTEFPASASATDEVAKFDRDLQAAHGEGVDQYSPKYYSQAVDSFNDAKSTMSKGKEDAKVLHELAEARAYLNRANEVAANVHQSLPDVVKARTAAVAAKAPQYQKEELAKSDDKLRSMTRDYEKGNADVSQKDRAELQDEYLAIELTSIKRDRLAEAKNNIDKAMKMKAEKWAPRSLDVAQSKFRLAEKTIETDRHDDSAITPVVKDATDASTTLLRVTQVARQTRNDDPERMALGVVGEQNKVVQKDKEISQTNKELNATENALSATSNALGQTQAENAVLGKQKKLDKALEDARHQFSSSEAEVYRQGDNLLIRLKGLQFSNGRSEFSGNSMTLLGKVKSVVSDLGAQHVVVEGHTDAVGSKSKNEALSEKRGEAVAQYLVAEKVIEQGQVETKGYGFSRPIASNKTATGRAENRRVDIIVTPRGADTTKMDEHPQTPTPSTVQ